MQQSLPNLPSTLGTTALCWNSTSGLLSACSVGSGGVDNTPPTITSNAPAVATQALQIFTISCVDDVELAFCGTPVSSAMDPGVKMFTTAERQQVIPLGAATYSEVVTATDMAGNSAKLKIQIQSPPVGVALKSYKTISPSFIPAGFDCRPAPYNSGTNFFDGGVITDVRPRDLGPLAPSYAGWSEVGGYILGLSVTVIPAFNPPGGLVNSFELRSDGNAQSIFDLTGPRRIPLSTTSVTMPPAKGGASYGGGQALEFEYKGTVEYVAASDELRVTAIMVCGTGTDANSLTWTEGVPYTFVARP